MKIILLGHPTFFGSHSMDRFAGMIAEGMRERGHDVELWTPSPLLSRLAVGRRSLKWLGYVDQYMVFMLRLMWRLRSVGPDTLFVLADHALGMWMPLVRRRPHVIHSHDFTALREYVGDFPSMRTSPTGRVYQALIWRGFRLGRTFVAVSRKTAADLVRFCPGEPPDCRVVYNGLNYPFRPLAPGDAIDRLRRAGCDEPAPGMLLHVGGNQWYKNRTGVLALYFAYCRIVPAPRPLWMIGAAPTDAMLADAARAAEHGGTVRWLSGLDTEAVHAAYALAQVLVFPSLEEGFGWPIIEAMACGALVLTTNRAPMNEVAGAAAELIEPMDSREIEPWARRNAPVLAAMAGWSAQRRDHAVARALAHAAQFSADRALDQYERIYLDVLRERCPHGVAQENVA